MSGVRRGVMFLLAGGPGQAATRVFGLGPRDPWPSLFRGYTLVAFDVRGTGASTPIHCARVASPAACARELGTDRDFYSTASNARDLEAVRRALGFGRISLFGGSYGTELALAYAREFPSHVARLVLDSVASPLETLPALSSVLHQMPVTLHAFCLHVCGDITTDYERDVIGLANSLARRPLEARLPQPDGGRRLVRLDGVDLVYLVVEADSAPSLAAVLPAAVHAAGEGNPQPLLRLAEMQVLGADPADAGGYSAAVHQATVCNDGPFPWAPATPLGERLPLLKRALARLGNHAFGGFGPWAWRIGDIETCLRWPVSTAPYLDNGSGRYPDVPVLVLAGEFDQRGTLPEARAVLAHFPRGRLLTVANVGHSVIGASFSTCLLIAIPSWIKGHRIPASCGALREDEPAALYPPGQDRAGNAVPRQDTLSVVTRTLAEAELMRDVVRSFGLTVVAGLQAGKLDALPFGLSLSGYGIARGVTLTGSLTIDLSSNGSPAYVGSLRIGEAGATEGTLTVDGGVLDGDLGGMPVIAGQLTPAAASPGAVTGAARLWSAWTPEPGTIQAVTRAIANHVASQYLLDAGGAPLVEVSTGPLSDLAPIDFIQIFHPFSAAASAMVPQPATNTWTYDMCGHRDDCSIPGTPTAVRGQLVLRESLELALYTFKLLPAITSVFIELPAVSTGGPSGSHQVVALFPRSEFSRELAEPLARTLPLPQPPLPSSPDPTERATIDKLTRPDLYNYQLERDPKPRGSFTLVLVGIY